ncbi:mandelate racemase/muconate lactonizing enzyme family protein [Burkholderia orbicola]|uniref:mandelate racemase/muconate lactonizing enzyme family protein n=1 Tax=Burkholderia orbicola TaxID=2978683 RepID=UPI0035C788FE
MKIVDVEAFHLRGDIEALPDSSMEALLIKVTTDAGIVGWGEADGSRAINKAAIEAPFSSPVVSGLRHLLLGEDPMNVTCLWKKMYESTIYSGREGAVIHAMAGVDLALWDIKGKALQVPVHQLLGGCFRSRIPAYASTLFEMTPGKNAELAKKIVDEGYTAMKMGWQSFGRGSLADDIRTIEAIRTAAGDAAGIAVDAGFAWTPKAAMRRVQAFAPYNLMWIEEPLVPDDLVGYERLSNFVSTEIAAGEEDASINGFVRLMDAGIDYIQIDLTKTGLTMAMQVAAIANQRGLKCINHNFSNHINTAASLHFLAAIPNAFILEYGYNPAEVARTLILNPIVVKDGYADVPMGPGLGVEPDPRVVERFLVRG